MASDSRKIRVDRHEGVAVVTVCGALDLNDVAEVVDAFTQALSDASTDATLIDLSGVTFADSAFLNQLLVTYSGHGLKRRPLALGGPLTPTLGRLLEITGTDTVLPLAATRSEALERLRAPSQR
ncbi:STAS domain-containing protein [Streptomyces sp. NPDC102406]|uniref:STAS domain-containing protein n=1 Tax=Streptomyces sp. NPDC102406 TaxID=3366171 RepID=UPI0038130DE3